MQILLGLVVFCIFIVAAIKVGVVALKVLFTLVSLIVGTVVFFMLLPLGLGLGMILIVPAMLIGIIVAVFKCIMFIF